ncbi:hypothetical protein BpHYR1_005396 [Brachionus plicatilis]|uniref:Uncharacterized protein n=1 Tax=Brachionus plicatilis TaxID=10195 RepID=A0A3M7R0L4_BRAPC|nr:hypothetical protein BpHYR1_005396 [Brachionus plicatilis]
MPISTQNLKEAKRIERVSLRAQMEYGARDAFYFTSHFVCVCVLREMDRFHNLNLHNVYARPLLIHCKTTSNLN